MVRDEQLLEIATAIYPKCIEAATSLYDKTGLKENPAPTAAKAAIRYADELLRQYSKFKQLSFEDRKNF